jgi:hypothetical protein
MPGAWVDHHERAQARVGRGVVHRRLDAHQRVVGGLRQGAAVDHDLVVEHEHRRTAGLLVLQILVATLAQNVEREDEALASVHPIGGRGGKR